MKTTYLLFALAGGTVIGWLLHADDLRANMVAQCVEQMPPPISRVTVDLCEQIVDTRGTWR